MRWLLGWLDQWARNIALERENRVLRDELEETLDENVRLHGEVVQLRAQGAAPDRYRLARAFGLTEAEAAEYAAGDGAERLRQSIAEDRRARGIEP